MCAAPGLAEAYSLAETGSPEAALLDLCLQEPSMCAAPGLAEAYSLAETGSPVAALPDLCRQERNMYAAPGLAEAYSLAETGSPAAALPDLFLQAANTYAPVLPDSGKETVYMCVPVGSACSLGCCPSSGARLLKAGVDMGELRSGCHLAGRYSADRRWASVQPLRWASA